MNPQELENLLNEVLVNDGEKASSFDINLPLIEQGIDSLTLTSFFFEIEDKYEKVIPDEQIGELKTLQMLSDYLQKN